MDVEHVIARFLALVQRFIRLLFWEGLEPNKITQHHLRAIQNG
jgi:hypothetical protein